MADLFLPSIIDRLLKLTGSGLKYVRDLHSGVDQNLTELRRHLFTIEFGLARDTDDVKIKGLTEWRQQVLEVAYDAEDLLEEFDYRRLEQEAEEAAAAADAAKGSSGKVKLSTSLVEKINNFTRSPKPLKHLASILKRIEKLADDSVRLFPLLKESADREALKKSEENLRETTSAIRESVWVGRSQVSEQIVNLLMGSASSCSGWGFSFTLIRVWFWGWLSQILRYINPKPAPSATPSPSLGAIPVVLVVGGGGFGKTTLAQHVFNDERVKNHFEAMIWVHVSQKFDVKRITKDMIESATRNKSNTDQSLESLQQHLKDAVGVKRFLLVLDDMWCGDDWTSKTAEDWKTLLAPLSAGARERGSIILLTTRDERLKNLPGALLPPILLPELSADECWSIIRQRAFDSDEIPQGYENLERIGKKIAGKVHGSPLAAIAVGSMLHDENRDYGSWNRILETGMRELPGVKDVLKLSYQHLPTHLRKCFAYCSLFPKGYEFYSWEIESLGRMWVSQGFIQAGDDESIDEPGRKCFNHLISRSFFQESKLGTYRKAYVMHDLMNDLARQVSEGDCLILEGDEGDLPKHNINLSTVRHLSVNTRNHLAQLLISNTGFKLGKLRSFISFIRLEDNDERLTELLLPQLRRIRVLHLEDFPRIELPNDFGIKWIHLRYLRIKNTFHPKRLPKSLLKLYHLLVLSVHLMENHVVILPRNVNTNLRIFGKRIFGNPSVRVAFLGRLTSLEELEFGISVEREKGYEVGQLKRLDKLRGRLIINKLENVESREDALGANLCDKKFLEELFLVWREDAYYTATSDNLSTSKLEETVLEALQPPSTLKELGISGYGGLTSPTWMHNESIFNLTFLRLHGLKGLAQLPPLGQLPHLKKLRLIKLPALRKLGGNEFYGHNTSPFPSLERMYIDDMELLEEWFGPDVHRSCFPRLQYLEIKKCQNLRCLPRLGHVKKLDIPDYKDWEDSI